MLICVPGDVTKDLPVLVTDSKGVVIGTLAKAGAEFEFRPADGTANLRGDFTTSLATKISAACKSFDAVKDAVWVYADTLQITAIPIKK